MAVDRLGTALDAVMRQADDYLFDRSAQAAEGNELTALRDLRRARTQLRATFETSRRLGLPAPASRPDAARCGQAGIEPAVRGCAGRTARIRADGREPVPASRGLAGDARAAHRDARRSLGAGGRRQSRRPGRTRRRRCATRWVRRSCPRHVRIALYKFIERELATALTPLYDRINARLGEAGILPRLLPSTPVVEPPVAAEAPAERAAPGGDRRRRPKAPSDHALFSSLIGMLQSWRQHMMPGRRRSAQASAALGVPQLMSALSLLQSEPPGVLDQALGDTRVSLGDLLRREVLAGARRLGMGGDDLNLSAVQEDAVDLVGMLFDVLLDERDFQPDVRRKIGRMLVPYVKVAVKDRRMFVYKGHPARRFLNAVAEACEGNHGDAPQERELLDHVDASIDRLVAEFNEDVAIFETLEQELRAFMAQHRSASKSPSGAPPRRSAAANAWKRPASVPSPMSRQQRGDASAAATCSRTLLSRLCDASPDAAGTARGRGRRRPTSQSLAHAGRRHRRVRCSEQRCRPDVARARPCRADRRSWAVPAASATMRTKPSKPCSAASSQLAARHGRGRRRAVAGADGAAGRAGAAGPRTGRWPCDARLRAGNGRAHARACRRRRGCSSPANPGAANRQRCRGSVRSPRVPVRQSSRRARSWSPRPRNWRRWRRSAACNCVRWAAPSTTALQQMVGRLQTKIAA